MKGNFHGSTTLRLTPLTASTWMLKAPAMPFDHAARALDAQTASRPQRTLPSGNPASHVAMSSAHPAFRRRGSDSNRMQIARHLPEQHQQIFEQGPPASRIQLHQRQSAGQFQAHRRIVATLARHRLRNQFLQIHQLRRERRSNRQAAARK